MARRRKPSGNTGLSLLIILLLLPGFYANAHGVPWRNVTIGYCVVLAAIVLLALRARGRKPPLLSTAPFKAQLLIGYNDAEAEHTERKITIRRVDGYRTRSGFTPVKVQAYCHLRHSERTFLLSRISYAADTKTGEIIADLPTFLAAKVRQAPAT